MTKPRAAAADAYDHDDFAELKEMEVAIFNTFLFGQGGERERKQARGGHLRLEKAIPLSLR